MMDNNKYKLIWNKNEWYAYDLAPREAHQIEDELLQKEKELGVILMLQRDLDGRL